MNSHLLESLVAALPDAMVACDPKGRVILYNSAAERLLGYTAEHALTQLHVSDLFHNPDDGMRLVTELEASAEGARGIELRMRARSGEQIPVRVWARAARDDAGRLVACVSVYQDQREAHGLRHRLEQTTEQLVASEKRASAMTLAGVAANELVQPLTAAMGTLELLTMGDELPARVRTRLERAYSQLERMVEIVRSLHRASQPGDTGRAR